MIYLDTWTEMQSNWCLTYDSRPSLLQVVRKETERLKNEINNEAAEIAQNATAEATVIRAKAEAEALLTVEKARDTGLSYIYKKLNITKEEHKSSFNYLRTLRGQQNVKFNVGYSTLMARD